jgi:hypothetical protein
MWSRLRRVLAVSASLGLASCAWFRSAINESPEIRWWLFSHYGADRLCPELQRRAAPLRLTPGATWWGGSFRVPAISGR